MSALPLPNPNEPTRDPSIPPLSMAGEAGDQPPPQYSATPSPLDASHFAQLEQMARLARPIGRAARYANFSGWTTLLAGALSLPFALGNSPMLVFCIALAGIGAREVSLRKRLIMLETTASKKLAINQLCLAAALSVYAVYMLTTAPAQGMVEKALASDPALQSSPEMAAMLDDMVELEKVGTALMYIGMIAVAGLVQGTTAVYYATKGGKLKKLHRETPEWAVRVYQSVQA